MYSVRYSFSRHSIHTAEMKGRMEGKRDGRGREGGRKEGGIKGGSGESKMKVRVPREELEVKDHHP